MGKLESAPSEEQRIVNEILGDVEVFEEGDGPNGPWYFRSLTVHRRENEVIVKDVDGQQCDHFHIDELEPRVGNNYADVLRGRLERLNEETLDEL